MSALPEQYQKYAAPIGQHTVQSAAIELYDDADPIVHVADPYNPNRSIAVRRSALLPVQPSPARDLTPQPLFDPLAQRMAGGGIGAGAAGAGIGWGIGQAAAGIAAISGTTALAAMCALWLLARAGRAQVHVHQEVHQKASWFSQNRVEL